MTDALFPPDGKTIRNLRRDFPEWHRGRTHYALWAVDLDLEPVRRRMAAAQGHLGELLLDDYRRQAHITLRLCGFPCAAPRHCDDFSVDQLRAQLQALQALRLQPFEIGIGAALRSFTSAPFLSVTDRDGELARLHECLAVGSAVPATEPYVPHLTVGLYAGAWPVAEVRPRLASFAAQEALRLTVRGIQLTTYRAREIGGPLSALADYDFRAARLRGTAQLARVFPALVQGAR